MMPSVIRPEHIKVNGMQVRQFGADHDIANNIISIEAPKDLRSSEKVTVEFLEECKLKNPRAPSHYRLKIRTSIAPDDIDVDSNNFYICPEVKLSSLVLIPSTISIGVNQTGQIQR